MASKLKRVSEDTADFIEELAEREGRTFVAQLDRIVDAGLVSLGLRDQAQTTAQPAPKTRKAAAAAAK
jgi:hypothetical protein